MTDDPDYLSVVRAVWREVCADPADPDGIPLNDAREAATDRLLAMVEDGDLKIPPVEALRAALAHVDNSDGALADSALRRVTAGQAAIDLGDVDPMFAVVARIAGRRKPWGDVTAADLSILDHQRYENARNAQNAYDKWRSCFTPAWTALTSFPTLRDAYDAGQFDLP